MIGQEPSRDVRPDAAVRGRSPAAPFARRDALACSDFMRWFDGADGLRAHVAGFIHCQPADIAFVQNAPAGLSLLLGGLDWKTSDRIVTPEDEFPNRYYYPSHLRCNGVEFVETVFEQFYDCLTPGTRLVAIGTVNYSTDSGPRAGIAQGAGGGAAPGFARVSAFS